MTKKYRVLDVLITVFLMPITLTRVTENCLNESEFNKAFSKQLSNEKLSEAFVKSSITLGMGTQGILKEIQWKLPTGFKVPVSVKRVPLTDVSKEEALKNEIRVMKILSGVPKTMQMIGCMEKDEKIIMKQKPGSLEWQKGPTSPVIYIVLEKLYSDLEEKPLTNNPALIALKRKDVARRLAFYLEILLALKELHKKKIVHGDLKPANIMVSDESATNLKLVDFGVSNDIGKAYLGTAQLFSPFEADRKTPLEPSFDIYSFGVTVGVIEIGYNIITSEMNSCCKNKLNLLIKEKRSFISSKLSLIPEFGNTRDKEDNFSLLISDCLFLEPVYRPSVETAIQRLNSIIAKIAFTKVHNFSYKDKVAANLLQKPKPNVSSQQSGKELIAKQSSNSKTLLVRGNQQSVGGWGSAFPYYVSAAVVGLFVLSSIIGYFIYRALKTH